MKTSNAVQQTRFYSTGTLPSMSSSSTHQQLKLIQTVKKFHIHMDYHVLVQLLWFKQAVCWQCYVLAYTAVAMFRMNEARRCGLPVGVRVGGGGVHACVRVCVCVCVSVCARARSMVSSNGQVPLSSAKEVKPNFISLCIFTVETERVSDNSDGVLDTWTVNVLPILFFFLKLNKYSNRFNIGLILLMKEQVWNT